MFLRIKLARFFLFVLRQDLRCSPGWPQICNLPASASQMLELQVCTTMPVLAKLFKKS
jgi:hypothetical protein